MSSLGVVSTKRRRYRKQEVLSNKTISEAVKKELSRPYRMVLPVLSLIQWGTGLFCFCFTARVRLVRKDFWEGYKLIHQSTDKSISTVSTWVQQREQHSPRCLRSERKMSCTYHVFELKPRLGCDSAVKACRKPRQVMQNKRRASRASLRRGSDTTNLGNPPFFQETKQRAFQKLSLLFTVSWRRRYW